jgi:hypothetical protein
MAKFDQARWQPVTPVLEERNDVPIEAAATAARAAICLTNG